MKYNAKLSEEHQKEWKDFCEKLSKLNLTKDMTPPLNYIYGQLEDSVTLNGTYWDAIRLKRKLFCKPNLIRLTEQFSAEGENMASSLSIKLSVQIVRIMAPLIENSIVANEFEESPIHFVASG